LLTGGFGTVGLAILDLLLERGHRVTVFEVRGKRSLRLARSYAPRGALVFFGDIRSPADIERALAGQDAVVHCAAIVPPFSDESPERCFAINVGGTRNLARALAAGKAATPLIFVSSASVMGPTQDREPGRSASEPVNPTDNYARSKVEAEAALRESGARHCVLRLGAVMPMNLVNVLKQFRLAFDIPLEARCEIVVDSDVAAACVNAAELMATSRAIDGSTFFIGGGKAQGCQLRARELYEGLFSAFGLRVPPAELFASDLNNYYIDWYDTEEAQRLLRFQNHGFADFRAALRRKYGYLVPLALAFRPLVDSFIRSKSPYRRGSGV